MRTMIKKERGLTAIGLMFVLATIAGVVLIALRLFPLYNEKFQIESALSNVASNPEAGSFTTKTAGKAFMKGIAVTNISSFSSNNIDDYLTVTKPKKKGAPKELHFKYESRNKFVADIQLVMVYDKVIPLTGPDTGD